MEKLRDYNTQIFITFFKSEGTIAEYLSSLPPRTTVAQEKGARNPDKVIPRTGLVTYESQGTSWNTELSEHWENFKDELFPYRESLILFSKACDRIDFEIIVDYVGRFPFLELPIEMMLFASDLGASIEVLVLDDRPEHLEWA